MKENNFEYFTAAEAGQYTFYRIPKALFTAGRFQDLSCEAKVLYGMMLDRMGLSIKNGWLDSEGRVYIVYTVEDVMAVMGCGTQKAVRLIKELDTADGIGLIEKRRLGLGRPNRIYVKNFMVREGGGTDMYGGMRQGRQEQAHEKEQAAADTQEQAAEGTANKEISDRQKHASVHEKEKTAADAQEWEPASDEIAYTENAASETGAGCVSVPKVEKVMERETCPYEYEWWEAEADGGNGCAGQQTQFCAMPGGRQRHS